MTLLPTTRMRLYDRGAIREGLKADVTIFNKGRIEDVATYEGPTVYPAGIEGSVLKGAGADTHTPEVAR